VAVNPLSLHERVIFIDFMDQVNLGLLYGSYVERLHLL
jgi:hypothetical protein